MVSPKRRRTELRLVTSAFWRRTSLSVVQASGGRDTRVLVPVCKRPANTILQSSLARAPRRTIGSVTFITASYKEQTA